MEKIFLLPELFGGEDIPPNVVFIPPGLTQAKEMVDSAIARMAEDGLVTKYEAVPEYRGNSHVPCRLVVKAWDSRRSGKFESKIELW